MTAQTTSLEKIIVLDGSQYNQLVHVFVNSVCSGELYNATYSRKKLRHMAT